MANGTGTEPQRQAASVGDQEIDLRELAGALWGGRWLIAAVAVAVLFLGAFYAWKATPIYRADALVQVELKGNSADAALGELATALGSPTPVTAELEIIGSRLVVGKVVDKLNLDVVAAPNYAPLIGRAIARRFSPENPGEVRSAPLGLRQFAWGGERIELTRLEVPESMVGKPLTLEVTDTGYALSDEEGVPLGQGVLGEAASLATASGALNLFVRDLIAASGTKFTLVRYQRNQVVESLRTQISVSEKGRQSGIIAVSLEGADRAQTARILNEVVTAYQRQNVERKSEEAEQTLLFLRRELPELRAKLEGAEEALNQYRLRQGSADLTKETELVLQQTVALEESRLELERQREEALRRFTPEHPVVVSIDAQLEQIKAQRDSLSRQIKALPETQQELLRFARDVEVNTALYTALLNNAQELEIVKAGTVGNVRIIDHAVVPMLPAKPKVGFILALSLLLGLMLGVVTVFLRRAFHSGVADPAVVEAELGLPAYGAIPYSPVQNRLARGMQSKKGGGNAILAAMDPDNPTVEALRSLRTALHFALMDAPNNTVMLTGPAPDLGKSFTTINLGAVIAATGKRVLVIDGDLRRGHLDRYAGCEQAPGLSDWIASDVEISEVVKRTPVDGLYLIPKGTTPPNPAELLLNRKFAQLLEHCGQKFDQVIVDSPPVLAVADASIIGRLCGTTLMVLKAGEHPLRMIDDTVKRLRNNGVEVRGSVMNQVGRGGTAYSYSYGYNYQYAYDYRSK